MIWISTLCLLAIAAWLFFNATNERRWVDEHSHDEAVASDEGLFSSLTALTGSANLQGDGKVSIEHENSGFARAVSVVQEKSAKLGEKLEAKVAAARAPADGSSTSIADEDTMFGRMVAKVGAKAANIDTKLDAKMKAASADGSMPDDQSGTFFERTSRKVAQRSEELTQRVANRTKTAANNYEEKRLSGMKVGQKHTTTNTPGPAESEDLMTRVSAKVDNRISEMDAKIVDTSNKVD